MEHFEFSSSVNKSNNYMPILLNDIISNHEELVDLAGQ